MRFDPKTAAEHPSRIIFFKLFASKTTNLIQYLTDFDAV